MRVQEIIRRPLITEKSTELREDKNVVASRWRATPTRSRSSARSRPSSRSRSPRSGSPTATARCAGRAGSSGRRPDWKKAYVRLAEGEKPIEFFEGM